MRFLVLRISGIVGMAILLGRCADPPLSPDEERASLSAQGSLTPPSDLTATPVSPSQVDLAWRDKSSGESGFEMQRSTAGPSGTFALLTKTGANVTTYSNTGLSPSTSYCYKVRAIGGTSNKPKYSAFSNTSCATPPPPPAAPSGLKAIAVSSIQLDLSWIDNASDETGFNIERCQDADCTGFVEVAQVGANAAAWVNSGLMANTTYRYRVRARRGTIFSEFSTAAAATTMSPPVSELNVEARTTGVDLDADGYRLDVGDGTGVWRSANLPSNGNVRFSDLKPGNVQIQLSGEAPNCYLTSPASLVVDLNGTATATFDLMCERSVPIAFASMTDGNPEIYTISSTGTGGSTRLTFDPASDGDPAWSPDGGRIAFRSDRDGNADIYVMNSDGSNPVPLTSDPAEDGSPAWSPDGSRIAFESSRDTQSKIYVMNADGSAVSATNQAGSAPAWSPDGQRIAFTLGSIYLMNTDGTSVTRLTNPFNDGVSGHMYEYDTSPAWSPDGASVLFARTNCDGLGFGCMHQVMRVSTDGSAEEAVSFYYGYMGTDEGGPVWSPEGQRIAFANVDSIVVLRADGTYQVPLTVGFSPAWRR